ncbi:3-deoxy-D-manno-octulosonic acid transferase [bacterium]|nr:MAG: 3-deoxy-D-manno-octulosonic acid transferase [bacterium]
MFLLFNLVLTPLVPALGLYTLHRRYVQKKSAASFRGQWGIVSAEMKAFSRHQGPKIWLHAVSVGETMAAKPIARVLKAEIPNLHIALSSTTDTGHELAAGLLKSGEVDCAFYFPLDLAPVQSRVLGALKPNAICFVETELWPNLLHLARKKGIPTFLVNGRVSDNLLKTAPKLGLVWKWMSGNMSGFLMRGQADADRLKALKVADQKIFVTGDIKLEAPPASSDTLRQLWRERLEFGEEPLIIAGSTHPGEEEMVLQSYGELLKTIPNLKLAIAPRHNNRADEVSGLIEKTGYIAARRSNDAQLSENTVYLLDTVGELADFYAAADVTFVGGSLIPRGGHNVLEPILRGSPVLFGPHMMNFRAAAEVVTAHQLGSQLENEAALSGAISSWLSTADRPRFEAKVSQALAPHQGAAQRMARHIAAAIK